MPTYNYRCEDCGKLHERVTRMADHVRIIDCECGGYAGQVILQPPMMVIPDDFKAFISPSSGQTITNNHAYRNDLARTGCMEYEPGMKQDKERRDKQEEDALDKSISESLSKAIEVMPPAQREQLARDVATSDLSITRI